MKQSAFGFQRGIHAHTSGTILGMCFGIIHRQNRQRKLSEQRRHDKERSSRCTHTRLIPARTRSSSPHYIQLHFVENDREINHKSGGTHKIVSLSIASIVFVIPARSATPTWNLKFKHPKVTLCLLFTTQPLAANQFHHRIKIGNRLRTWSFRSGPLGIKKRKNKTVGPNIGWPYPWHFYLWRSFYSTAS